uniref:Uncharacterized protein n=1 Tax=Rhizophora mucronata TaxID=61149 RepID=A0A2P2NM82_RHIMU
MWQKNLFLGRVFLTLLL